MSAGTQPTKTTMIMLNSLRAVLQLAESGLSPPQTFRVSSVATIGGATSGSLPQAL